MFRVGVPWGEGTVRVFEGGDDTFLANQLAKFDSLDDLTCRIFFLLRGTFYFGSDSFTNNEYEFMSFT